MNEYFFLAERIKPGTAFAYTLGETPLSHELIPDVIQNDELPFGLTLKKVSSDKNGLQVSDDLSDLKHIWLDYQPNNLAWPLMSLNMKEVVNSLLTGNEGVIWIKAQIKGGDEHRDYFIPRFQQKLDVIDEQKTIFVPGTNHIIKPVFSRAKLVNYSLFFVPQKFWQITSGLYIDESLKIAMQKRKLTGVGFEKTSVI